DKATIDGPGAFSPWDWWIASAEEQLVYFLACSAPDPPERVPPEIYYQLARATARHNDGPPFVLTWNGALFTYFFSQCWIDYRSFDADDPTQFSVTTPRVDWFENSRRATLTHRQRCIEAANEFKSFAADRWGLSPCTGFKPSGQPTYLVPDVMPNRSERDNFCFGTVAPYAAGSTIVFTPEESMQALRAMRELTVAGKPFAWQPIEEGGYGFVDSFNLDQGLASDDHVGIDVGPMLLAIENARTGLIWKLFMQHATSRRAVKTLKWQSRN
ncbi:MAG: hypothetical protein KDA99_24465, partial [Planctomycetales bacterium]|nr:hypothetical protein [Planctomycetales bacterium]